MSPHMITSLPLISLATAILLASSCCHSNLHHFPNFAHGHKYLAAFARPSKSCCPPTSSSSTRTYALDPVTYLRTEWVSAALCSNQTPRTAEVVLQLGSEDGRIVNFVPRTVRKIITSSAENKSGLEDGGLTVSCQRQLKQMAERRKAANVIYSNQPADNLIETPSSSVDVVISLQSAQRMLENGLDWKKSVVEAGRVLKPGGRFLFVESEMVGGDSYLEEILRWNRNNDGGEKDEMDDSKSGGSTELGDNVNGDDSDSAISSNLIFDEVGYDSVDMVLQPHIAGVAIKAMDVDLTLQQRKEIDDDRLAELSLNAFERGNKKRKRKKKENVGKVDK